MGVGAVQELRFARRKVVDVGVSGWAEVVEVLRGADREGVVDVLSGGKKRWTCVRVTDEECV